MHVVVFHYKFEILAFSEMIEQRICNAIDESEKLVERDAQFSQDLDDVINEALGRLHVLHCTSLTCALATMPRVDKLLSSNRRMSLLVLDSISAFYNSFDFSETRRLFSSFVSSLCRLCDMYKISIFAAKAALFPKDCSYTDPRTGVCLLKHKEYMGKLWTDSVRYRLVFCAQGRLGCKQYYLFKASGFEKQQVYSFKIVKHGVVIDQQ